MELISKKTSEIIVRRSQEYDLKNIFEFHHNQILLAQPKYLQNTLESFSGISLVAYKGEQLLGHILVIPLSSQTNIGAEEAAVICGIWTNETDVAELLVREAMMCAWEAGFHALFSFENHPRLKKVGFIPVKKDFFTLELSNYYVSGIELSWNGFQIISKNLTLPKTYLSSVHQLNHFSSN